MFCLSLFNFIIIIHFLNAEELPPPCYSKIYCQGEFLHTIQMNKPFPDSKTFVDMKIKTSEEEILKQFKEWDKRSNPSPNDVKMFLDKHFDPPGSEFEDFVPEDWVDKPDFISHIEDNVTREFALELHLKWKMLGRKIKDDVRDNPKKYSIIYVPNPVVVPGGRFREFYYWDTYWIILGLLVSGMTKTAKGMINNFCSIVEQHGFIPNGGRIYYLTRSQPPLLIPMMYEYVMATNDVQFLIQRMGTLEKEFKYWTDRKVTIHVGDKPYEVNAYGTPTSGPRPESYTEDYYLGSKLAETEANLLYSNFKAAAESGWDFSTRWFISKKGTNEGSIKETKAMNIAAVDLNAILCGNARLLAELGKLSGKQNSFASVFASRLQTMEDVFWRQDIGAWLDYDMVNNKSRDYFYASNLSPLWTKCYKEDTVDIKVISILQYLKNNNIGKYYGGIPTSLKESGEQWDLPNSWPPFVHYIIVGLNNTENNLAMHFAYELASQFVRANFKAFNRDKVMHEKFDAIKFGRRGGGGEYEPQEGFGWSNGVVLDLFYKYGNLISGQSKHFLCKCYLIPLIIIKILLF